jgi:hypothetical protein
VGSSLVFIEVFAGDGAKAKNGKKHGEINSPLQAGVDQT